VVYNVNLVNKTRRHAGGQAKRSRGRANAKNLGAASHMSLKPPTSSLMMMLTVLGLGCTTDKQGYKNGKAMPSEISGEELLVTRCSEDHHRCGAIRILRCYGRTTVCRFEPSPAAL